MGIFSGFGPRIEPEKRHKKEGEGQQMDDFVRCNMPGSMTVISTSRSSFDRGHEI